MSSPQTLLQLLQTRTIVDCDTMDVEVAKELGPFVDCTSNQAIAYFELSKPVHEKRRQEVVQKAISLRNLFPDVPLKELVVEIGMISLQIDISKHVTGFVHVQTNPWHSFSTQKMVSGARRIVKLFTHLDPAFDAKRVCIKIPSTWEGLSACRELESSGISTLATTLFNMTQVALAGEVGCRYIAPYVNELKVHFEPGFVDHNKAQQLCLQAQRYYEKHNVSTQVLPASLTSTEEIMQLAGVHHITISPPLLRLLADTPASNLEVTSLFDEKTVAPVNQKEFKDDEEAFRLWFCRSGNGEGERKLVQAINIFCDMQLKLEKLFAPYILKGGESSSPSEATAKSLQ